MAHDLGAWDAIVRDNTPQEREAAARVCAAAIEDRDELLDILNMLDLEER